MLIKEWVKIEAKSVSLTEKRFMLPKRSLMAKNATAENWNVELLKMALVADHDRSRDRNHAQDRDPVDVAQDPILAIEILDPKVDQRVDQKVDLAADKGNNVPEGVTSLNLVPLLS